MDLLTRNYKVQPVDQPSRGLAFVLDQFVNVEAKHMHLLVFPHASSATLPLACKFPRLPPTILFLGICTRHFVQVLET
jgi:hypothetical protein